MTTSLGQVALGDDHPMHDGLLALKVVKATENASSPGNWRRPAPFWRSTGP
jgi:hypothetical protein